MTCDAENTELQNAGMAKCAGNGEIYRLTDAVPSLQLGTGKTAGCPVRKSCLTVCLSAQRRRGASRDINRSA